MPLNASEAISPAYERTKQILFNPFVGPRWLKLALVVLGAGEVGGATFPNFNFPMRGSTPTPTADFPAIHWPAPMAAMGLVAILALLGVLFLTLWLFGIYFWSRFRFVLFDTVIEGDCQIGRSFARNSDPGHRLFGWMLLITALSFATMAIFIGGPIIAAIKALRAGISPGGSFIAAIFGVFGAIIIVALVVGLVLLFIQDFVIPVMALERFTFVDSCRRVWQLVMKEPGVYVFYVVMKIVLAIGLGIIFGIGIFIALLVLGIPLGIIAAIVIFAMKGAGTAAIVVAVMAAVLICVPLLFYVIGLISVPLGVFRQSFAMYFFAGRYPPLGALIVPQPIIPVVPRDSVQPQAGPEPGCGACVACLIGDPIRRLGFLLSRVSCGLRADAS